MTMHPVTRELNAIVGASAAMIVSLKANDSEPLTKSDVIVAFELIRRFTLVLLQNVTDDEPTMN